MRTFTYYLTPSHHCRGAREAAKKGCVVETAWDPQRARLVRSVLLCCSAVCGHAFISFIDKADSANVPQHREVERTLSATSSFRVLQKQDKTSSAIQAHDLGNFTMPPTLFYHKQTKKRTFLQRHVQVHRMQISQKECLDTVVKGNLISYSCPRSDFW